GPTVHLGEPTGDKDDVAVADPGRSRESQGRTHLRVEAGVLPSTARSDVYALRTAGECAIWACRFAGRPIGVASTIFCRRSRDAAGASSTVWVGMRLIDLTSFVDC